VPIEIADPEDIETADSMSAITIEGRYDDLVQQFIYSFPYKSANARPVKAAQQIVRHLINDSEIEKELVSSLYQWMKGVEEFFGQGQRKYWDELFYNNHALWTQVGYILNHLLARE
jgi:hypothetical protein